MDIRLIDYELTTAAGVNLTHLRAALQQQLSGLRPNDYPGSPLHTWIGRVPQLEDVDLPPQWRSRNNALASLCLDQGSIKTSITRLVQQFSASRIGVVMGSSTASIDRTELAYTQRNADGSLLAEYRQPMVNNPSSLSLFVAYSTGINGPALTINTACSSSAKVFATGARWLSSGIVDAVLVGGVDSLCMSVLHGFDSLQLVSANRCKPFDQDRDGINLGEAAAYALLVRADARVDDTGSLGTSISLGGYGESSDAYHMSHPHPEGRGARLSIQQALDMAQLAPEAIDYINLHGTSSRANDLIEGQLIEAMFPLSTQCSSTKGWMGHTLGAAGIVEGLIAADALITGLLPGSMNLDTLDSQLNFSISPHNQQATVRHVMSNSFGFGGNNCSLLFSKVEGE